ncbi:SpvB/TcaC N-terminal domain-containing protein [Streptomyces sp. NPDC050848]|uniref:SpvB/TcaC N-terminal domain-containing protein n=1 Tax=Streptomyces sp. NPDC050848 TaxID=3155791 RepID=UPI0034066C87
MGIALLLSLLSGAGGVAPLEPSQASAAELPLGGCIPGGRAEASAAGPKAAAAPARTLVTPDSGLLRRVEHQGAEVAIAPEAVAQPTEVGIQALTQGELPGLGAGMENVTGGPRGYRFTPTPHQFEAGLTVSLPYDPEALKAAGMTPADVRTFFFDEPQSCWRALERITVDEERHLVVSRTDHFTDMVNATVTAPEGPEQVSYDPTQIKGITAADPTAGVNQIAPPAANNQGDARLTYPLDLPGGRGGLEPSLAVTYSSAATGSWLGTGWSLTTPAIGIETRWGVPRYDAQAETETYLLGGDQLTPVAHRAKLQPRSADKVFHTRVEGGFARIVRKGDSPKNYAWEVTDKSGVRWLYGGEGATLSDDDGNIFSWALREVRDPHGNTVRYRYALVEDAGVAGGTVKGRELYVRKISYTGHGDQDGPYTVTFLRDRDLDEPRRTDVAIDARGGFKRVTADLLRRVEVRFGEQTVRRYDLGYTTGAFHKTLLKAIEQFDADGKAFNRHEFDYFDDIRDAKGRYEAFAKVDWTSPDDNVRNGTVDAVKSGAGEAGALNGNTSRGAGGHLYVGWGAKPGKSGSVGVKAGYNRGKDEGLLALVDVDGDSLPDKVFKSGGGFVFRKNLSRPGGQPRFADATTELKNLPGILSESSSSRTIGIEAYLGGAAQLDYVDTFSTTRRYFTDVNADGVVDLVDGSSVLFGRVDADGTPSYGAASETPVPIGSGTVDTDALLPDYGADRERRIASFPLIDSLRRWTAPYDGTVRVTGAVALKQAEGDRAEFTDPDGVRVAVQHQDRELWSKRIGADDRTEHTPEGVGAIDVRRGDHLYFRVGSVFDGSHDQVAWDPEISYAGVGGTDANGLPLGTYTASKDFTLAGRSATITVPADGTLHLTGDVRKKAATTDDVTVLITRGDEPVLEKTIAAADSGTVPVDLNVPVTEGQKLSWRLKTDSAIDVRALEWAPVARYATGVGEQAKVEFHAPYDIDTYPHTGASAPPEPYTVAGGGSLTVTPRLTAAEGVEGSAVFTVKKRGALLAKETVRLGAEPPRLTVSAEAGDELYFDFAVADPAIAGKLTGHTVTVGGEERAATVHGAAVEGVFARPYRGWSAVGYNGNKDRAEQPVEQADLTAESIREGLPDKVDPVADREAFENDPRITPPNVVPFTPDIEHRRWGAGEFSWVAAATASSSRYGGPSIGLPTAGELASAHAVPRMSRSKQLSLTGSLGGGVGSVGGSVSFGTSSGELDYLDMNADGFPDVVGAGGVQYTGPTGILGATRGTVPGGKVRESETRSGNASAGSAARTITTGRGHADPPASSSANTASSGNDMPPLGVGGNLGASKSDGTFDLLDINGDNLPDRVYEDGRAALNLGYRFAAPESWPGGRLNEGSGSGSGLNLGFNTDFYGFAGGVSFDQDASTTKSSLADVNSDGLDDRVFTGDPIKVALNTGSGFADPVPFHGSLDGINADNNAKVGGGAYFTLSYCFVTGCLVINPGANVSTGASRAQQMLRDIDGDGLADHLASTKDSELTVAANRTGRTNLLKSVARPLGSRIDLAYTRDGNTYDQPGSRWLMSRAAVHDGLPGDGADTHARTFRYEGGGYDRLEREFLGYGEVATEERAENGSVYRTATRAYDTRGHYTRGLPTRETLTDASGALFTETLLSYRLRDVATDEGTGARSTTATVFPQLVRTERRWYEGRPEPGKRTVAELSYDRLGNVTRTVDHGEAGTADDVETLTRYTECADTHIVGAARAIEVRGSGKPMRKRETTVDCATGEVTRQVAELADGTQAVTDLTYHDNGTLKTLTQPANHRGQRYQLTYTYDGPTGTYVTETLDSFGYRSTAEYDLRFGQLTRSTDINGHELKSGYDAVGRVTSVTGPHDHDAGRPTIAFAYHPEATVPYAVTRHLDRASDGSVGDDTIDTVTFTDGTGRVVQTKKDATVEGTDVMTVSGRTVYDALGRDIQQSYPVTEPKGAANFTLNDSFDTVRPAAIGYDVLDRTVRAQLPDGTVTTTAHGFGEDRAGTGQFETVTTDAKGIQTRTYDDVRGQRTAVREPGAKDGDAAIWTSYLYDPLGQLTQVRDDKGNTTTSAYDDFGRRTTLDSPDAGRTTTVYDPAGNVVRKVTANLAAKDQAVTYTYDHNRLSEIKYPVFTGNDVRYTYGGPGAPGNGAGRVTRIEDAAGEVLRTYGPLGETAEETRTLPGPGPHIRSFTTSYRHDSFGRVLQLTYPDGEVLSYDYDSGGQVRAAKGTKNGLGYDYLKRLEYDKFDQRVLMELGNGTRTRYDYDAEDRRLATLKSTLPTGYAFQNVSYGYDEVGNVTRLANDTELPTDTTPKLGGPSTQTFGYDNLYRLTEAKGSYRFMKNKTDTYALSTSYDTIHNITGKTQRHAIVVGNGHEQAQRNTTYGHAYAFGGGRPHAPSAVGPETLSYDANGNLVDSVSDTPGSPRRQQVWDEDNRLACVHDTAKNQDQVQDPSACYQPGKPPTVRFTYDDQGDRVVKDGAQTTLYPNQHYSARNQTEFKHVFVGTTRIATKTSKPGNAYEKDQFFYHGDHVGSTSFGTDGTGRLAEHLNYFPSGETWVDENPGEKNSYQFTGKELDQETGYYYHGSRYYDPRKGLWQGTDPALGDYLGGSPNGGVYTPANLSSYAYAINNPLKYTDPTGAYLDLAIEVVSIGIGVTSFVSNVRQGNYWAAAADAAGVVVDTTLAVVPGVPGGVGLARKAVTKGADAVQAAKGAANTAGAAKDVTQAARAAATKVDDAAGGAQAARSANAPCPLPNSFLPETEVVMADGSAKPIEDVGLGELVLATDPESGRTEAKPVTHLIEGAGAKNLVKVTVDVDGEKGSRTASVTATDEHPFWVGEWKRWVDAADLRAGMWLRTDTGDHVRVTAVTAWTAKQRVNNLTVADLHTYYVRAGASPVLVHNCKGTLKEGDAGGFGDLTRKGAPGDDLTAHHMPQNALGHLPRNEGGALALPTKIHEKTRTFAGRGNGTKAADAGKPFRQVLAQDIRDVRGLARSEYGSTRYYNQGLGDLMTYYRTYHPNLLTKTP